MELWLLGAGAIVLIAITLWIVWPARPADAVDQAAHSEEEPPMSETARPGGATPAEPGSVQIRPPVSTPAASEPWSSPTLANEGTTQPTTGNGGAATRSPMPSSASPGAATQGAAATMATPSSAETRQADARSTEITPAETTRAIAQPRTLGVGAGLLLSVGGAVGGAWLYARWQRERNKPINRLRRGARDAATRLGERMPDIDELPRGAAPMGGAASAVVVSALLATRALRHRSDDRSDEVRDHARELVREAIQEVMDRGRHAMERGQDVIEHGRERGQRAKANLPARRVERKPAFMGLGLGGIAMVAGASYVVWRLMRSRLLT